MVFFSRVPRHPPVISAVFLAAMALTATGCSDNHIGRLCDLGVSVDGGYPTTVVNSSALECPSRICLLPAPQKATDTAATCTAECSSDDDCSDSEKRNPGDTSDKRCTGNFVCRIASTTGDLACRKLCVCSDFVNLSQSDIPNCTP